MLCAVPLTVAHPAGLPNQYYSLALLWSAMRKEASVMQGHAGACLDLARPPRPSSTRHPIGIKRTVTMAAAHPDGIARLTHPQ